MNRIMIAPSILSCNFLILEKEIRDAEEAGADLFHIDVMDGHFVPNITIGPMFVEAIRKITSKPLDCHLMISNPSDFVKDFINAGADIITIHIEADTHIFRSVDVIKAAGIKAGVTLNPSTPLCSLENIIETIDLLLIMTVNPGFGGQSYITSMDKKIRDARQMIDSTGRHIDLEVDGGIKASNVKRVADAGADIVVMGTEFFHSGDYRKKVAEIMDILK
ncbi:MAG TPA: ribulose-phosphate 3-epimerase [Syntrophorhabdaceae bacterium]|nr:ribulose-phosphate 3-epimerase [Syntrophorhabdaceae bacterium]HOL04671.1 ribulose-phosphate 3-epimerase [Syntrophorhabdaceae bacterium]HPC66106.1 ribulose-phosphate 3-epimerase [Syntrophorhabdaceae bacterium]HPP41100.1 ribulose-phosphate 3-epimerase [Syntrophorhabdaceae bacterium]HRR71395.1 ribulose-phosphate 3-epimerase [Syntrophorhabdaceae bacterium]